MANQMSLPGLDLANDEVALRDAWARVPDVRKLNFDLKIELPFIRQCLARVAEIEMGRRQRCRRK